MTTPARTFRKDAQINWYRTKVDKQVMKDLLRQSDYQGFKQVFLQLGLYFTTAAIAYALFLHITIANAWWSVPVLLLVLFLHWTQGPFLGFIAVHELCHKTPFKSKFWNEFFLKVYSFLSWSDYVWFRQSHVKHHQVTTHKDYDGEVELPQEFDFRFRKSWQFYLAMFAWWPLNTWNMLRVFWRNANGRLNDDWSRFVLPENDPKLRRQHRNWARFVLLGHLVLAAVFIATGNWFLILVITMGTQCCHWFAFACIVPQHYGLTPNVPDFRLCCRSFIAGPITSLLYWNMQHHIEHHMYPGVPFYNLPRLRKAIEHELPAAPHGLLATWRQILEIHRRHKADKNYRFVPELPGSSAGERVTDERLEREAAAAA